MQASCVSVDHSAHAMQKTGGHLDVNMKPSLASIAPESGSMMRVNRVLEYVFQLRQPPAPGAPFDILSIPDILDLIDEATNLFRSEGPVVDAPAPSKIFGDIHGQLGDLLDFFRIFGTPNHRTGDIAHCSYVFNGDFVDRGQYSLEVIIFLFALKLRYPKRVFLNR